MPKDRHLCVEKEPLWFLAPAHALPANCFLADQPRLTVMLQRVYLRAAGATNPRLDRYLAARVKCTVMIPPTSPYLTGH
jgi:hypothetical protein